MTTEIEELVKRARQFAIDMRNHLGPPETCPSPSEYDMEDIADALEAQAARVKELTEAQGRRGVELESARETIRQHLSRIADLEAQLEALRDAAEKEVLPALEFYKNPEVYKQDSIGRIGDLTFRAFPAIRALMSALQMEKKDGVE